MAAQQIDTTVGFIGLGAMGSGMAKHLNTFSKANFGGRPALVWNRVEAGSVSPISKKAAAHADKHGTEAVSLEELGNRCDILCLSLPTSDDVAALLASMPLKSAALVIDTTSGDPAAVVRLAQELAARGGVRIVDAPVSGGADGADAGTLASMLGGAEADVARAKAVCACWSDPDKVTWCGPLGAGDATKAVNNTLMAANLLLAAEGVLALKRFGVPPATALQVINQSSGGSKQSAALPRKCLGDARFPYGGFGLALLSKDTRIGGQVAEANLLGAAAGTGGALLPQVVRLMQEAEKMADGQEGGAGSKDYSEAVRVIEAREKLELRK